MRGSIPRPQGCSYYTHFSLTLSRLSYSPKSELREGGIEPPTFRYHEARAGFEPANPKDLDLNQAHLTALLPLLKRNHSLATSLTPLRKQPLGRIELPTCSLRVNRSATELKRPKREIKTEDAKRTPAREIQAQGGDRTHDLQINSLSHYRLCYSSSKKEKLPRRELNPGLNGDSVIY